MTATQPFPGALQQMKRAIVFESSSYACSPGTSSYDDNSGAIYNFTIRGGFQCRAGDTSRPLTASSADSPAATCARCSMWPALHTRVMGHASIAGCPSGSRNACVTRAWSNRKVPPHATTTTPDETPHKSDPNRRNSNQSRICASRPRDASQYTDPTAKPRTQGRQPRTVGTHALPR